MENQNIKYQRPSWDEYFLKIVEMVGSRGTCERGRAGCVITKDKRIISTGYVGSPIGLAHCDEIGHEMHTVIQEDSKESRHCIRTTHSEQNAICQAARVGISLQGATLYCTMTPCYTCAKMIINVGITRVVCAKDYHASERTKEIFSKAGIKFELLSAEILSYPDMGSSQPISASDNYNPLKPTTAQIFIYDEFTPEDTAMLQALYSRSPETVVEHVQKVKESSSGKFMEKFYIGYGHKSIADCGSTTLFIEKLSILADKAIQDWPLYSGQETSTRYVDMSKQPLIDPVASEESKKILSGWMNFYINNQIKVQEHIAKLYPRQAEDESVYQKAIKALAFDIMRGFLPAGITTQLSWHTNLRQAWDKLCFLRQHPIEEVKQIAEDILKKLKEKYPHSFSHESTIESEQYQKFIMQKYNFYFPETSPIEFNCSTNIKYGELYQYEPLLANRPAKAVLPHFLTELGTITFDFILDFGSFRDIQRHRNGVCRMPLLTTKFGFNNWYLEQLPNELRQEAEQLIEMQKTRINQLPTADENKQYYIALGFNLACRVTYGLPAAVYVLELRSTKAVHPTLRKIAYKMHFALKEKFPFLKLHTNLEKDDWDIRRGTQDISQIRK